MPTAQPQAAWVPTPPEPDSFANRLRLLRLGLGDASVQEMAERCGVPTPTWRTWERGALPRNMPAVVRQIHDSTGVDMAWLMWGAAPGGGGDLLNPQLRCTVREFPELTRPRLMVVGKAVA